MVWKKPDQQTRFHIDMVWWDESGLDFRLYLRDHLCDICRERYPDHRQTDAVDWINPETAEVLRTDALVQCLRTYCMDSSEFLSPKLPLITAVFRVFLANGNEPLSATELHEYIPWKTEGQILQLLSTPTAHLGVRPVFE